MQPKTPKLTELLSVSPDEVRTASVAASDKELMDACKEMARLEGIFGAPESGAGLAAIQTLVRAKKIGRDESVVLFSTGGGYKYMEAWQPALS